MTHKKYLLFFLGIMISSFLFAQDGGTNKKDTRTFRAAAILGFNAAQIDGDDLIGYNKFGFHVGGQVSFKLKNVIYGSLELLYSQKGSRTGLDNPNADLPTVFSVDYVEIPLLVKYVDRRLEFYAGGSYGRLVRSDAEVEGVDDPGRAEAYRKNDVSFIGGGAFFLGESEKYGVDIRFTRSILNIVDPLLEPQVNRLISLRFIYRL